MSNAATATIKQLLSLGVCCGNPKCGSALTRVAKTERHERRIVRHRECLMCGHRFKTIEE